MKGDNKKVLSTSYCGRPSSMDFVKSFLLLFLYISGLMFFLDVSRFCPKRLQSISVRRKKRIFQTAVSLLFSAAASGNPGCKTVLLCAIAAAIRKCMIKNITAYFWPWETENSTQFQNNARVLSFIL